MFKPSMLSILVLLYFVLANLFLSSDYGQVFDHLLFDKQVQSHSSENLADPAIVVIAIDDYSLKKMAPYVGNWVWPRSVHAELIEGLNNVGVSSIVFDIIFSEKDIYRPDADDYLNEVLEKTDNVFMPVIHLNTQYQSGKLLKDHSLQLGIELNHNFDPNSRAQFLLPNVISPHSWLVGTINFSADSDGVGRRYDVKRNFKGWSIMSLPAKVAATHGIKLPLQDEVILNWQGNVNKPYKTLHYADIYQAIITVDLDILEVLKGKHVLIGATAAGLYDTRVTPISHNLPGVYMLATALDNLLNSSYFREINSGYYFVIVSIFSSLIYIIVKLVNGYIKQLIMLVLLTLSSTGALFLSSRYLMTDMQLMFIGKLIFVLVFGFMSICAFISYLEYLNRKQAIKVFSRFLDPIMVKQLIKEQKLDFTQLNQKISISVLFTDIRNFTSYSENNSADEVVELLNKYFTNQVAIVFKHGGTLDKFIGDCIMAFWGAPTVNCNHACSAISAALEMEQELVKFKQSLPDRFSDFEIGIGVHSGTAIVGMVGAEQRVDYTAIGDTVNLASRIEGLTKDSSRVLVSEQSMELSKDSFRFEFIGEESVKGRNAKVKLYQPKRTG